MSTLAELLRTTVARHGDRVAVVESDRQYRWHECGARVARATALLQTRGVEPGSRFGVIALNSPQQAELFQAGYWGATSAVPINPRLAPGEIAAILRGSDCRLLAIDSHAQALLESDELAPWRDNLLHIDSPAYERTLAATAQAAAERCDPAQEAIVLYTGGTTGGPKAVVLSHANVLANALQVAFAWPPEKDDLYLHVAPMFHSADLVSTAFTLRGAAHTYLPRFTPRELLRRVEQLGVTAMMVVPAMLIAIVEANAGGEFDVSSLRRILYGASPIPLSWMQRALRHFTAVRFTQGYGLTETAPIVSMLDDLSHRELLRGDETLARSCGRPLPGVEVRIVDEQGRPLASGRSGEIEVRGANVFNGYLGRPDLTAAALHDGWYATGDIGMLDARDYLYVLDRKKDVVIVGGECVYSNDVEEILSEHPAVLEVAVVGVPHGRLGERVFAVVVPRPDRQITRKELREFCRGRLGAFKIPTGLAVVDALPRSPLGKVLKNQLRERFAGGQLGT